MLSSITSRPMMRKSVPFVRMCSSESYVYETLEVSQPVASNRGVFQVQLNRPTKANAMDRAMWREMREVFDALSADPECRAIVVTGAGRLFTGGIDLVDHVDVFGGIGSDGDVGRKGLAVVEFVKNYQASFTAIENCRQPVIAAVHSGCIGGGIDLISACDIRFCSADAYFSIKEVAIGLAADVGTLQRMPKIVGNDSLMRDLAFTGRNMHADEALRMGFVSRVLGNRDELLQAAYDVASTIAENSPIAVAGTKNNLNFSRDHPVSSGLKYVAAWNASMIQTEDVPTAATASMSKSKAEFKNLLPKL